MSQDSWKQINNP